MPDDLAIALCTRIGMIMEDSCPIALTVGGLDAVRRRDALRQIERAARQLQVLAAAASELDG